MRELALYVNRRVVRGPGWMCVADIMASFHGFGVSRAYGTIVYADTGEPYEHNEPIGTLVSDNTTR